ncbi:MAG: cobalt ECF transporter T component CbiQ [Candidatus Omnitrophota bacterium]
MSVSHNFIERFLAGALSFLKESIFAEEYALKNGFLQARDPRIKVFATLLFLLSILLAKSIFFLFGLYLFCLFLSAVSQINIKFFLKRTWIFIPLFSFFIALPALFEFFTPGEPLLEIPLLWGKGLVITRPGLYSAAFFLSRVATCVSFVILLSLTTRHTQLLRVLRIFGIPQVFVMVIGMCYRYIYLFIEIIENTYRAMESRAGRHVPHNRGREIVTWNMASLWQRSYQLNNEIYNAMLSRGYRGEPKVLDEFKTSARDWAWLLGVVLICLNPFLN